MAKHLPHCERANSGCLCMRCRNDTGACCYKHPELRCLNDGSSHQQTRDGFEPEGDA